MTKPIKVNGKHKIEIEGIYEIGGFQLKRETESCGKRESEIWGGKRENAAPKFHHFFSRTLDAFAFGNWDPLGLSYFTLPIRCCLLLG
jgi:hypothetical protein